MVVSVSGELVSVLAGVAVLAPLALQVRAQIHVGFKSPVPRTCWLLWAIGLLGVSSYFLLVPSPPKNQLDHDMPEDVPASPRSIGVITNIGMLLCLTLWGLDGASDSRGAQQTMKVVKEAGPLAAILQGMIIIIGFLHPHAIKSRYFYFLFLQFIAEMLSLPYVAAYIFAMYELNPTQLKARGPELAGLFSWAILAQALGIAVWASACALFYDVRDWTAIYLLIFLAVCSVVYLVAGKYKIMKSERTGGGGGSYSSVRDSV